MHENASLCLTTAVHQAQGGVVLGGALGHSPILGHGIRNGAQRFSIGAILYPTPIRV